MAEDTGDVETIDAPLETDDEELVKLLDEPVETRQRREDEIVAPEATPPDPDSEYFTAPLLDADDHETER
jgi:hypothetical protein